MGLLSRGQDFLTRSMQAAGGVAATYTRKDAAPVPITPWVGRTLFAATPSAGGLNTARVEWGERDYLVPVDELVAVGTPQKGDRIAETIAGTPVVFEATSPTGEPCWRYSDQTRTVYRIHVRRVA